MVPSGAELGRIAANGAELRRMVLNAANGAEWWQMVALYIYMLIYKLPYSSIKSLKALKSRLY